MSMDGTTGPLPQGLLAHSGWARRLARQLVNEAQADDLVQDALVAGLRHPPASDRPLRGWLATVMRNLAHNRSTADRRRQAREQAAAGAAAAPTAEDALATVQLHRQLARLVERLPAEDRRIVVLRFFEERTSAQIGALLGVPSATVRWRQARALDQLRAWLDEESGGERRRWILAFAPLLRPTAGPAGAGLALAGTIGLLISAAAIVVAVTSPGGPPARPMAGTPIATLANTPPSAPANGIATERKAGSTCAAGMDRARAEFEAIEQDLRRYEDPALYFDQAADRPELHDRFAALIPELLTPERGGVLECREAICRVLFVLDPEVDWRMPDGPWIQRLQSVGARIVGAPVGGITRDPLSGELHQKQAMYLRLLRLPPPVPADPVACERVKGQLLGMLAGLRERQERALPPPELFARIRDTNRVATDQILAWLEQQAGTRAGSLAIECRGRVCRFDPWPAWLQDVQRRPEWKRQLSDAFRGSDGAMYHRIRTPRPPPEDEIAREQFMKKFAAAVQPAIKRCADEHHGADKVDVEILFPAPGELNADGAAGKPSVRLRGPDAEQSFGRCLGASVTAALRSLPDRPGAGASRSLFSVRGTRPAGQRDSLPAPP
jgi:RNA polymerase sigma-70 factor (ECF subfamily)